MQRWQATSDKKANKAPSIYGAINGFTRRAHFINTVYPQQPLIRRFYSARHCWRYNIITIGVTTLVSFFYSQRELMEKHESAFVL